MMKIKKNKYGFTLAETLCCLAIIGVCCAMSVNLAKTQSKKHAKYSYMNAFSTVQKAFYNAGLKGYNPFELKVEVPKLDDDGNQIVDEDGKVVMETKELEHSETKDEGTKILCEGLTEIVNTTDISCSDENFVTATAEELSNVADRQAKLQFITSNGMHYFISNMYSDDVRKIKFYLVYVDVNGDKTPNSLTYTYKGGSEDEAHKVEPDIFAFAVLENGRTCPLGIPEYDQELLSARVAYFDSEGNAHYNKETVAYYQAKGQAWGFYNPIKPTVANPNVLNVISLDEPFSMNDVIRNSINAENPIVKDFPDLMNIDGRKTVLETEYNCSSDDLESCYVVLDEFVR